ncbi:endolytic transglycosylase MltG [Anaerorhabdus sp.]|uniref:endolytic transglycosylase MltG n=1 Tax=Anaerorhabdus sp. TaxID=1872524 RepID=UPI002B206405|nr:endolytic transglycosylase MltG [Anaerorhabdus sp.]MEA4875020.1 endolytic transglycosylase MltG [Anaerorhabdus sp.]
MTAKKKKIKRKLKVGNLLILIGLILILLFGGSYAYYSSTLGPVSKTSEQVEFTISSGESVKTVIKNLKKEGLIQNDFTAQIYAKVSNLTSIKMGTYSLDKSWSLKEILSIINDSKGAIVDDSRVTIIEGDWAKHIASRVAAVTNVTEDDLFVLWNNPEYIRSIMGKYPFLTEDIFNTESRVTLEGYLFPNTYDFFKETTAEQVTEKILDQTLKIYEKYKDQFNSAMASRNLTLHELFTLASIVQYEAAKPEDMKMIAGVFYNRLNKGMMLQSSVTVCYAIDIDKGDDWMKCEVNPNFDSPYNTYKYTGLPPGPILNPGEAAIEAVLNPTESNNYYFMADVYGDGTVYYAETYAEHQKNVNKYLKK